MTKHGQLMQCGCAAYAHKDGKWGCGVHNCWTPMEEVPDLSNREAKCLYCGTFCPSDTKLPFFEYVGDREYDRFYCGCRGWN